MAQHSCAFIVAVLLVASTATAAAGQVGDPPVIEAPADGDVVHLDPSQPYQLKVRASDGDGDLVELSAHINAHMVPAPFSSWDPPACAGGCATLVLLFASASGIQSPGVYPVLFRARDYADNVTVVKITLAVGQADVGVQATAAPDPVVAGDVVTYTLTVVNNGPQTTERVELEQRFLTPHTVLSVVSSVSCVQSPPLVTCSVPSLPKYGAFTVVIDATVDAVGSASTSATATSLMRDPHLSNNTVSTAVDVHAPSLLPRAYLWAWGDAGLGLLGNGATTGDVGPDLCCVSTPQAVSSLGGVIGASAGVRHSLALAGNGTVWAWGRNGSGELGNGTLDGDPACGNEACRSDPAPVHALVDVAQVAAGHGFSLAVDRAGTVWAWGDNADNQLGVGRSLAGSGLCGGVFSPGDCSALPLEVTFPSMAPGTRAVAAGATHALALRRDRTVWAWGAGYRGELGLGGYVAAAAPVGPVLGDAISVAAAAGISLAVKADGTVWAWGDHRYGQLGSGVSPGALGCYPAKPTVCASYTAVQVAGLSDVVAVAAAPDHLLAIKRDGSLWAWGANDSGQLGDGTVTGAVPCPGFPAASCHLAPVRVRGLAEVGAACAGSGYSVALERDGTLWAWGAGWGVLGDGGDTSQPRAVPTQVVNLGQATALSANRVHVLALGFDVGPNITVRADTGRSPAPEIRVTFDEVIVAGSTEAKVGALGPKPPAGFQDGQPALHFDVQTTAGFAGRVTVCVEHSESRFSGTPALFRYEETAPGTGLFSWVDKTVSVDARVVCGAADGLSLFGVFSR